jgi:hypothetical protein
MRRRARLWAVALTLILMSSPVGIVLLPDANPYFTAAIRPSDLSLALLIALTLPDLAGLWRRRAHIVVLLGVALAALLAIAFAAHPAPQGALTLGRFAGTVAMARALVDLRAERERGLVLVALAISAATQSAIALGQLASGSFLSAFGDDPYILIGPFFRANGTLPFGYVLAGLALVGGWTLARTALRATGTARLVWSAIAAFALVPIGITFSRAAAAGHALGVALLLPGALRRERGHVIVLTAVLLGAGLPALITIEGWTSRIDDSPTTRSATNRIATITQSLPLIAADPLFGVGPGRSMVAIRGRAELIPGSIVELSPPHDVPVAIALEAGIPAGLVALALVIALGRLAWRRGTTALLVYAPLVPYVLLDNWPYTTAAGLILLGLWAAGAAVDQAEPSGPRSVPAN